jgi:hypothetical protein
MKKDKRMVVSARYLDLLEQKADLLNEMFDDDGSLIVNTWTINAYAKLKSAWKKADADFLSISEPYVEPKASK